MILRGIQYFCNHCEIKIGFEKPFPLFSYFVVAVHSHSRVTAPRNETARIFDRKEFGTEIDWKQHFVQLCSGDEEDSTLIVKKELFLSRVRGKMQGIQCEMENVYFQFMECTLLLEGVDGKLGSVCLRSSRDDKVDCALRKGQGKRSTKEPQVNEWFWYRTVNTAKVAVPLPRRSY